MFIQLFTCIYCTKRAHRPSPVLVFAEIQVITKLCNETVQSTNFEVLKFDRSLLFNFLFVIGSRNTSIYKNMHIYSSLINIYYTATYNHYNLADRCHCPFRYDFDIIAECQKRCTLWLGNVIVWDLAKKSTWLSRRIPKSLLFSFLHLFLGTSPFSFHVALFIIFFSL